MYRRHLLGLAALALSPATAHALEALAGPVVLEVSGRIRSPNRGVQALFDMAMLEKLPQHSFSARTPWYTQPRSFTGPLLRDVLAAAGSHGTQLRAVALNDYVVDIPVADATRWDVLLARRLDDKPLTVRDKGPLFIVYPFDDHAELRNSVYYSRCAWQLKAIEVA